MEENNQKRCLVVSAKTKGTSAERELVHKLWAAGWAACRVAGSGSMHYPSPDIIALKNNRVLVIECKTTQSQYQYFEQKEISSLKEFAIQASAEPWIGLRFSREDWRFFKPEKLIVTKQKNLVLRRETSKKDGLTLEQLLSKHL